jgi:hypothetical protein
VSHETESNVNITNTMACTSAIAKLPSSFVYENLIDQVQVMQIGIATMLEELGRRINDAKPLQSELKHRSFTFIDPFGNEMAMDCMDHEYINHVINKYKREYVPRYLHQRIEFGIRKQNLIAALTKGELKSTVSGYDNDRRLIAYVPLTVWYGSYDGTAAEKLLLKVSLMDNMKKIEEGLARHRCFANIEFKAHICADSTDEAVTHWGDGASLQAEDTIMSKRLYEKNCVILAKFTLQQVNHLSKCSLPPCELAVPLVSDLRQ